MSKNKVYEIRVRHIDHINSLTAAKIIQEVAAKDEEFRNNFQGYVKITYVSTPQGITIDSVEPIHGSLREYFQSQRMGEIVIPTF